MGEKTTRMMDGMGDSTGSEDERERGASTFSRDGAMALLVRRASEAIESEKVGTSGDMWTGNKMAGMEGGREAGKDGGRSWQGVVYRDGTIDSSSPVQSDPVQSSPVIHHSSFIIIINQHHRTSTMVRPLPTLQYQSQPPPFPLPKTQYTHIYPIERKKLASHSTHDTLTGRRA
jgi:hypothetical protein